MTAALEGGEGSASRPGRSLPPRKTRYPMYRRQGGPQGRSEQVRKISLQPGFDSRTVQPVASRYTDNVTQPTNIFQLHNLNTTRHRTPSFRYQIKRRWYTRKGSNLRKCYSCSLRVRNALLNCSLYYTDGHSRFRKDSTYPQKFTA
jgi:hypothetical protein